MKIMYFDDFKLGIVKGDTVVDVSSVVKDIPHLGPGDLMNSLIERFADYRKKLEDAAARGTSIPLAKVRVRPPLPKPSNVNCMAVNFMEDGTRLKKEPISCFHKSPQSIIGNDDTMVLPDVPSTIFEGEAELALVIGKTASKVNKANAMDYVFGYLNLVDGSARGLPQAANAFFPMKSPDTFCPIGPYIVTADEIKDPHNLQVRMWTNGVLGQTYNTNDMAHDIPTQIEFVTGVQTMEPGDILATGTNHRGLHPMQDGDVVEMECDGCGRLRFKIKDDLKRTWKRETRLQRKNAGLEGQTPQLTGKYAKT